MQDSSSPIPTIDSVNVHDNGNVVVTLKEFIPSPYYVLLNYDTNNGVNYVLGNPVETPKGVKDFVIDINSNTFICDDILGYRFRVFNTTTGDIVDVDIENKELDTIMQTRVSICSKSSVVSNLTSLSGMSKPGAEITVSMAHFDDMYILTKDICNVDGAFEIILPYPTLGKRNYHLTTTGIYGEKADAVVSVNPISSTENLLYNPMFKNNAEIWEVRGAQQTIQSEDEYTSFTLTDTGDSHHLGAVQSLDLGTEQLYTLSVEVRVNTLYDAEPDKYFIVGEVIPGGAMTPGSMTIYQPGVDFPLNTWVRLSSTLNAAVTAGFTTYGIAQLDVRNSFLLPAIGKYVKGK